MPATGGAAKAGPAPGAAGGGTADGGTADPASLRLADQGMKIRTADMTVAVRRGQVPLAADRAEAIAADVGGEVDADDRSTGPQAGATLQLRVPPGSLPGVLTRLGRLGNEQSRHVSTTDVTEKVADVNSRVSSAADAIGQLQKLYRTATRVSDVIAIEAELSSRQADLESLQAQQRALARQTELATVTLSILTAQPAATKPVPKKHHHDRGGFLGGLERGWHGFAATAAWLAGAIGTVLPFLVLLLLLALAARPLRRRVHRPGPEPVG